MSTSKIFNNERLKYLKATYFNEPTKRITLKRGDILLKHEQKNSRLYLVEEGLLAGYIHGNSGIKDKVFTTGKNLFVGVHSFFSDSDESYAEVVAEKDSVLAYIDNDDYTGDSRKQLSFDFQPVLVHELSSRQMFLHRVMQEKETALKKLFQAEKMASLGQMAAGIAHELNNTIGVIQGNIEWLGDEVFSYLRGANDKDILEYFKLGLEKGSQVSSKDARAERKKLAGEYKISEALAKKMSRIGLQRGELTKYRDKQHFNEYAEELYHAWQLGTAIHDMLLASRHSRHVLSTVKQLAVTNQERVEVQVNETIDESLTLLKSLIRRVNVEKNFGILEPINANQGELVQIWINIIKNSCESMLNAGTENPFLQISSEQRNDLITVKIIDNGPGIPHDMKDKIFQPNFTTKKGGLSFGLGLGLSIVQRLVDSYNGKIEVESTSKKTEFKIHLPVSNEYGKD